MYAMPRLPGPFPPYFASGDEGDVCRLRVPHRTVLLTVPNQIRAPATAF